MDRSPREDKTRDYERQSVSAARHGLRKQRHRIKTAAHRRYRRAESVALAQAETLSDDRNADDVEARIGTTRRERDHYRGSPPTLADHVTDRLVERFLDMVDTFSAGPYRPETQGPRTDEALTGITRERPGGRATPWFTRTTLDLDDLLPEPVFPGRRWAQRNTERRREWFAAFLADRPGWEARLVRWLADRAP
ncbi:hypothetical protein [Virgisporangium aurantiacum]|nr:hypothetical protein [Virgisporangium aurantiacum]